MARYLYSELSNLIQARANCVAKMDKLNPNAVSGGSLAMPTTQQTPRYTEETIVYWDRVANNLWRLMSSNPCEVYATMRIWGATGMFFCPQFEHLRAATLTELAAKIENQFTDGPVYKATHPWYQQNQYQISLWDCRLEKELN